MENAEKIDYEGIEELLAEAECDTSAAQLQAILCGMLAAGLDPKSQGWLQIVGEVANDGRDFEQPITQLSKQLCDWTYQQMNHHESLAPTLLPDDSYPLVDQLEALAEWCEGFLLGFGIQNADREVSNPEVRESLVDLTDISQLELTSEEDEETQGALFTLIEHVKVAVQLIYWEMVLKKVAGATSEASEGKTIH